MVTRLIHIGRSVPINSSFNSLICSTSLYLNHQYHHNHQSSVSLLNQSTVKSINRQQQTNSNCNNRSYCTSIEPRRQRYEVDDEESLYFEDSPKSREFTVLEYQYQNRTIVALDTDLQNLLKDPVLSKEYSDTLDQILKEDSLLSSLYTIFKDSPRRGAIVFTFLMEHIIEQRKQGEKGMLGGYIEDKIFDKVFEWSKEDTVRVWISIWMLRFYILIGKNAKRAVVRLRNRYKGIMLHNRFYHLLWEYYDLYMSKPLQEQLLGQIMATNVPFDDKMVLQFVKHYTKTLHIERAANMLRKIAPKVGSQEPYLEFLNILYNKRDTMANFSDRVGELLINNLDIILPWFGDTQLMWNMASFIRANEPEIYSRLIDSAFAQLDNIDDINKVAILMVRIGDGMNAVRNFHLLFNQSKSSRLGMYANNDTHRIILRYLVSINDNEAVQNWVTLYLYSHEYVLPAELFLLLIQHYSRHRQVANYNRLVQKILQTKTSTREVALLILYLETRIDPLLLLHKTWRILSTEEFSKKRGTVLNRLIFLNIAYNNVDRAIRAFNRRIEECLSPPTSASFIYIIAHYRRTKDTEQEATWRQLATDASITFDEQEIGYAIGTLEREANVDPLRQIDQYLRFNNPNFTSRATTR